MISINQIIKNSDNTINLSLSYYGRILRLHSSRPKAEAQKLFSQLSPNAPIYFIGGLGMGYLLEYIIENTTTLCIIYEPKSIIFETLLEIRPEIQQLLSSSRVIFIQELDDFSNYCQQEKLLDIGFIIHQQYYELFTREFNTIKEILTSSIRKKEVGNATLIRFSKTWSKNIFRNIHNYFLCQKLKEYQNYADKQAAIIIGAGPSLEDSLSYLRDKKDYAYLIACDTALPILDKANIPIDFVITVDPQNQNAFYLRYVKNKNHKLIADISVHSSTFEGYDSKNIILMDSHFPFYRYFQKFWGECHKLLSGGSVSTTAFDFARFIQADPIIMVGQDLAFTKKKNHSTGNILSEFSRIQNSRLISYHTRHALTTYPAHTQKITGRIPRTYVLSDARLILFRDWFNNEIPQTKARVILAGMDGAYIKGADFLSIENSFKILTKKINKKKISLKYTYEILAYNDFIKEMITTLSSLQKKCHQTLVIIKKAKLKNNIQQALSATRDLQVILSSGINHSLTEIISLSIQDTIQKSINISEHITNTQHLEILEILCQDIALALKELNKNLSKSQKFSHSL